MKQLRPYQEQAVIECWDALIKDDKPVLLMASVGAGKSLMISHILLTMQRASKRALCLVNNAELVRNNCASFIEEGGKAAIYCAALKSKEYKAPVVFGTPQSILNAIDKNKPLSFIKFNLIVVDEAHNINFNNHASSFMRILRHYKQEYPEMRLLGATGTNFRFKGSAIVGEKCLFKTQVGNITTSQLIDTNYLINPNFHLDPKLVIDFSKVKLKRSGQYDQKDLELVVNENTRLTELICKQVIHIMESQKRFGVFLFASTKKHAYEIYNHLPKHQAAIILGETPHEERTKILNNARKGIIKYLVNIAIISVGVDIPAYDTIAYLRPTESLVLLVQTMGRVLRLSPNTGKSESLVLDFAGNIERYRDWDDPLIQEAIETTVDKDEPHIIDCPACQELNTLHARRCIGKVNDKRCDYFFEFKPCPNPECLAQNDIAARHCRICEAEIIDPNEKLSFEKIINNTHDVAVIKTEYSVTGTTKGFRVNCKYLCENENKNRLLVQEHFSPISDKAKRVFYGQFVRKHCKNSSKYYLCLSQKNKVEEMLQEIESPYKITIALYDNEIKIKKKYFA